MKQKRLGAAIRQFTAAIVDKPDRDTVAVATGTLIQTLAGAAHDQSTQVFASLLARLERHEVRFRDIEGQMLIQQDHLRQIDRVLDEQARIRQ